MPFAALLLLSAQAAAPATLPPTGAPSPEKKICRRDTAIGSRLDVTKTCKTASEWAAYNHAVEAAGNKRQDVRGVGLNGR